MNPLISIIVPIYNTEKYIRQCIESIVRQTYKNLEIILIDDGSTDKSGKIADEYAAKDERVIVLHQDNKGESNARNRGLKNAKGDYVAFVDCDDWLDTDMYEKLIAVANNGVDMAACGYYMEYPDNTLIPDNTLPIIEGTFNRKKLFEYVYIRDQYRRFTSWIWCKLFKKELLEGISFDENIRFGADLLFFIRYASLVKNAEYIEQPLYHYRQRDNSTAHTNDLKISYEIVDVYKEMINYCKENNIEVWIIPWLERFLVYRASLVAEQAIEQKNVDVYEKCRKDMLEYKTIYLETNSDYPDRIDRYNKLISYKLEVNA